MSERKGPMPEWRRKLNERKNTTDTASQVGGSVNVPAHKTPSSYHRQNPGIVPDQSDHAEGAFRYNDLTEREARGNAIANGAKPTIKGSKPNAASQAEGTIPQETDGIDE
jgi:hypothetical protein